MGSFMNVLKAGFNPRSMLDPVGSTVGAVAGPNSWVAKEAHYDPLASSGFGKAVSPSMYAAGQAYGNRNVVSQSPTPYAGQQPTLANANNGYIQQSQMLARQNQVRPQPAQQSVWSQ